MVELTRIPRSMENKSLVGFLCWYVLELDYRLLGRFLELYNVHYFDLTQIKNINYHIILMSKIVHIYIYIYIYIIFLDSMLM